MGVAAFNHLPGDAAAASGHRSEPWWTDGTTSRSLVPAKVANNEPMEDVRELQIMGDGQGWLSGETPANPCRRARGRGTRIITLYYAGTPT